MEKRKIVYIKPEFEVTIGSAYFCLIAKKDNQSITYRNKVLEVPTIKTLGLTRTVSELEIYASGILFEYINRTAGANIALNTVALPPELIAEIEGALVKDGFTLSSTNDIEVEFAFGYWGENSDGSFTFYWHPVCKLTPTEENHETRTADIPVPQRGYAVKVIPYNNLWRVKYSTKTDTAAGYIPMKKEEFFIEPIYKENQLPKREEAVITEPEEDAGTTEPGEEAEEE